MQELFEKDINGLYLANTNDLQQSRFLPLLQNAEIAIKKTITKYFLNMGNLYDLRLVINTYISEFDKKRLPLDIENRDSYIRGLYVMANKVYNELNKRRKEFIGILSLITTTYISKGLEMPKISTPQELSKFIVENKQTFVKYDMWSQAKASVRIENYPQQLKEYINKVSQIPTTAIDGGKKPISIWQKAELDIRHNKQMQMVEDARNSGNDLFYISSHPDCSKRCQKWQGKLVSVTKRATKENGFKVGKVDGKWVYSLTDIMAQTDKYGYQNNIISGFNCRHYLIKYEKGKNPPKEYSAEDVKRMRDINDQIRLMERQIRMFEEQKQMFRVAGNKKEYNILDRKINVAIKNLRMFCNKNGFAFQQYRV